MFQQTIQDILTVTAASHGREELLNHVRTTIGAFERFECGELLAQTDKGLLRFVFAQGLGDLGAKALAALGNEPTLRLDTATELVPLGTGALPGLASLLILAIEVPGATSAAILLGHTRAWSFAAAPLSRIRTIGAVALRLLLVQTPEASVPQAETARLTAEIARLQAQVVALQAEVLRLRPQRSDTPR